LRDYTHDKHRMTDDAPYGGGPGMVMKVEPIVEAIEKVRGAGPVLLMSPQGERFNQKMAQELAGEERLTIVCGRYEGFDERVRPFVDREISIGDYILTGGEIAAMAVIDSVSRLVPGVLGDSESLTEETFSDSLIEYPHYTRPDSFRGMEVPEVLLSGNHEEIRKWRRREAIKRTLERRSDLLDGLELSGEDEEMLKEIRGGK
ncbi:MAG: tRNA (guanosine(37)-N1)-methyltransferase TrmD, partial [Nitrospinae bacterium]|nr:tRNA (guanosine(37)-N1)-methyltransferase TrmD [Nitrospinota bacterium]